MTGITAPDRGSPPDRAPGSRTGVSASELGLLIGMVAVFVAGLIAVSVVERSTGPLSEQPDGQPDSGT